MRARVVLRPSLRLFVAAALLAALGLVLAARAGVRPETPAGSSAPRAANKPVPSRVPDGCADAATTDGSGNKRPEILCGGSGADTIRAGSFDRVMGFDGADTIYAKNGSPNEIWGGLGNDIAYVDKTLDRWKGAKPRYTAIWQPKAAAVGMPLTPAGFPYELPTVECDDDDDGAGGRHILLLDPPGQKPQMAAVNANAGVVDWQTVAWATKIYKWDPVAKTWNVYFHSDWLWDRTYDLADYTLQRHPPNIWRSFVEGEDGDAAPQEPFAVVEPGLYNVRFRFYWYPETVADLPDRDLADMPHEYLFTPARKLLGRYATGGTTANQRYCKFP